MKKLLLMICCTCSLFVQPAQAENKQDHAEIRKVVEAFMLDKTQGMPGKITFKVEPIDSRMAFPACPQLEAFLPIGASLLGKTSIGVRCNEKNGWSLFVQVSVTTTINMLLSSKPLQQGKIISAEDFTTQSGELSQPGIVTDEAQIIGKVLKISISAGQLLKQDMFRPPYVVTQGQTIQLISQRAGFTLRAEGKAMNNAATGQAVQVKVPSGKVISGLAKSSGIVEVQQ
jgi:flagella basal body P-ring formation protein FlgA